ncbi:MAG: hypothetical protein CTY18_02915 [Methylomonas sp.]|nr:MAG: hypothetical protein CTY18_02915 [Methylomonas sp.]
MYCTQQNLIDRYGQSELIQLTDRPERIDPQNAGAIDSTIISDAIARAEARINRYLTAFLPLEAVPDDIRQIACDFARYFLYKDMPTDHVAKQYDDGIAYLEKVAAGKIPLAPDSSGAVEAKSNGGIEFQAASQVITSDLLDQY